MITIYIREVNATMKIVRKLLVSNDISLRRKWRVSRLYFSGIFIIIIILFYIRKTRRYRRR